MNIGSARRHETSTTHQQAVERELFKASQVASTSTAPPPPVGIQRGEVIGPLAQLLREVSDDLESSPLEPAYYEADDSQMPQGIDWDSINVELGSQFEPQITKAALSQLTHSLETWLLGEGSDDSASELVEMESDSENNPGLAPEHLGGAHTPSHGTAQFRFYSPRVFSHHGTRSIDPLASGYRRETRSSLPGMDNDWFPWPDKQVCLCACDRPLSCTQPSCITREHVLHRA